MQYTPESVARDMVREAARIEIVRAAGRREIEIDEEYAFYEAPPVFLYELKPIRVLKGTSAGPLHLNGLDDNWLADLLGAPRRPWWRPLWWATPSGYGALQETSFPRVDSADGFVWLYCGRGMTFVVGADYLVFRDAKGDLLPPGLLGRGGWERPKGPQRPSIERVVLSGDAWLNLVVEAANADCVERRKQRRTQFFELMFGRAVCAPVRLN